MHRIVHFSTSGLILRAAALAVVASLFLPALLLAAEQEPIAQSRRVINFAGRDWWVKNGTNMGPGPNNFSNSDGSVWVEGDKLHLKIRQIDGVWNCAEVWTLEPANYGNYRFMLESRVDLYDPNVVAGLFLYADDDQEVDIEFSRWGDPDYPAGSYSVQPYYIEGNNIPFAVDLEGDWTTHSFNWQPDYIHFRSLHGHYAEPPAPHFVIQDWFYEGDSIPPESQEMLLHINLWLMSGLPPLDGQEAELIVSAVQVNNAAQSIPLRAGWNLVSSWVTPSDPDLEAVFGYLIASDKLVKVQNQAGQALYQDLNGVWQNGIGDFQTGEGYYVLASADCVLTLENTKVALPLTVDLGAGWNIIPCPYPAAQPATGIMGWLADSSLLIKVQNELGEAIVQTPGGDWNYGFDAFEPGEGYYINVSAPTRIVFP